MHRSGPRGRQRTFAGNPSAETVRGVGLARALLRLRDRLRPHGLSRARAAWRMMSTSSSPPARSWPTPRTNCGRRRPGSWYSIPSSGWPIRPTTWPAWFVVGNDRIRTVVADMPDPAGEARRCRASGPGPARRRRDGRAGAREGDRHVREPHRRFDGAGDDADPLHRPQPGSALRADRRRGPVLSRRDCRQSVAADVPVRAHPRRARGDHEIGQGTGPGGAADARHSEAVRDRTHRRPVVGNGQQAPRHPVLRGVPPGSARRSSPRRSRACCSATSRPTSGST